MGPNWVFDKLREWVGTMTGKGDRWGRDSVGRSEPAFLSANTFALPPLTCTARGKQRRRQLLFAARPANCGPFVSSRPEPDGESAGCVCLQCLFCGLCACCHPLPAMPTVLISSCPRSVCLPQFILLCFAPVHSMCARIIIVHNQQFASCKTVPLAAATRACSGGPCAGSI